MNQRTISNLTLELATHATACINLTAEEQAELLHAWHVSPHDTVVVDGSETNGIEAVRGFVSKLVLSPQFGSVRLGLVKHTDKLTLQAQNALLKVVEEPPVATKLVLFTGAEANVLPTLLSRCGRYYGTLSGRGDIIDQWRIADPLTQLREVEALAKDDDLGERVKAWLGRSYQEWIESGRDPAGLQQLEMVWATWKDLETSLNKRLLLEQLVVSSL